MAFRVIATRSETVLLLTEEPDDPPAYVRILDCAQSRLFAPHPTADVLAHGGWEMLGKDDPQPDVETLLQGVDVITPDRTLGTRLFVSAT